MLTNLRDIVDLIDFIELKLGYFQMNNGHNLKTKLSFES